MRLRKRSTDGSKALRTLAFLVFALFITWLPSTIILLLHSALPVWFASLPIKIPLRESVRWVMFCNSMINPIAYALAQPLFRRTITKNALPGISVFGVVIICFDRYLATMYPLHHLRRKSKQLAVTVNVIAWLIPTFLWFSISTVWDLIKPTEVATSGFCLPNYAKNVVPSLIVVFLRACVPFVTIFLLSVQIYYKARSAGRNRLENRSHATVRVPATGTKCSLSVVAGDLGKEPEADRAAVVVESMKSRKLRSDGSKALRTLAFLVFALFITWLPSTIVLLLRSTLPVWFVGLRIKVPLRESVRWVMFSNSMINPIAYALAQPLFRRTITKEQKIRSLLLLQKDG
ncbi:5-hydroxytryptamine receptor 1B-like [Diadema setosum]|uniref:5-hydroxytryptamine receptor 1B-like n=1 Tax=Diadema setosum TaxID=31175 RepID=UPI003B3B57D4